jgi:hypothetical protein
MTACNKGLMQVLQSGNDGTAGSSTPHNQYAHLSFEQLRMNPVSVHTVSLACGVQQGPDAVEH